jgi:16S rRNA (adenine1518-N6/adenine1519-N6)-dimethyltransferase
MTEDPSHRAASSTSRPRRSSVSRRSGEASSTSRSPGSGLAVRERAEAHGIHPSKTLGQHFLLDPNLATAIARDAGVGPGTKVVEIGAGLGSLTVALAEAGAEHILAIEFDRALLPALREATAGYPAVEILHADATKLDWSTTLGDEDWICCGNLPYNVGTSIVVDVLDRAPMVRRVVVMLQREVAERLAASPTRHRRAYGAVSVHVAYRGRASIVRGVPAEVFWPRPTVGSAVVLIEPRDHPPVSVDERRLFRVVDVAFAQRRKTMRNALRRLDVDPSDADRVLARAGIDPAARPEELSLEAFARLAEELPA